MNQSLEKDSAKIIKNGGEITLKKSDNGGNKDTTKT
jgi:hypothetical protein